MPEEVSAPELDASTVGRRGEWAQLVGFSRSRVDHATLGVVWGRRRTGKSHLLSQLVNDQGLYYEAIRGSAREALNELSVSIGVAVGAPGPIELPDWDTAIKALMRLGETRPFTVVLDEYPYLREQSPEIDSVIQRAFAPRSAFRTETRCRLILCGSAISVMRDLLGGSAPLRGRASLDLRIAPFDYRDALALHDTDDLRLAMHLYAVIGGVAAYARDMVDDDVPASANEFDAWVLRRVLSPAAPLSREVELLLSEDPTTAQARKINLYHACLAGIALGHRTPGRLADYVKISVPRLDPILRGLVDSHFVDRAIDPIRNNRPTYHPGDSIIRFHYSIIRPNHTRFSRHDADLQGLWAGLQSTFRSQVVGPTFEAMARHWITHYADMPSVVDGPVHVGPSRARVGGVERELDVVVARDDADSPGDRSIAVIGEAKSGEELTSSHLSKLETARRSLGSRAQDAILVLFGVGFADRLVEEAGGRDDVELVDLERLYRARP